MCVFKISNCLHAPTSYHIYSLVHECITVIRSICTEKNRKNNTCFLPVEKVPVTQLLWCGVCRNIVVQVNKLWEVKFHNLSSHHYRGSANRQ